MSQGLRGWRKVWLVAALAAVGGCETTPDGLTTLNPRFFRADDDYRAEETHRREYQTTRSRTAMRWLLANRLQPGMSRADVGRVLGEEGTREFNDRWLKSKGGPYRVDDILYRFGPDSQGNSVYLAFRDDKLFNFDAAEFRTDKIASGGSKK